MVEQLELKLTPSERRDRTSGFEELREFIRRAAAIGGTAMARPKSFPFNKTRDIRVDLEIIKGLAAVPDGSRS